MYALARPWLFRLDAEQAHDLSLKMLDKAHASGLGALLARRPEPLPTRVFGLDFPNPVGLAAGVDALVRNVEKAERRGALLGINIGKNRETPNEIAEGDYMYCLSRVYPLADYVTVNISSPNTAGLRELQEEQLLRRLVGTLREEQERLGAKHGRRIPMLVKIAPDLSEADIEACARVLTELEVDGVIATNTTVSRVAIEGAPQADETGGLSGRPLMGQSTTVLRMMRTRLPESIPLIGVGGILSGADAVTKMAAGASLVQCYSGLVYRGPGLVRECVEAIRRRKFAPSRGPVPPVA